MKPFVSSRVEAVAWRGDRDEVQGGRLRWLAALCEAVLPVFGLIVLAEALSVFEVGRTYQFLLTGGATGVAIGKGIVIWRERRGSELPPGQVRRTEGSWFAVGVVIALLLCLLSG